MESIMTKIVLFAGGLGRVVGKSIRQRHQENLGYAFQFKVKL